MKFQSNRESLLAAFEEFSNPLNECESNLMNIVPKDVLGEDASESARNAKSIGLAQSSTFTQDWLISRTKSLYDNIAHTKLPLFRQKTAGNITSRQKKNLKLMKDDCHLFSRLYIACQTRAGDLDNFFAQENHSFPVSISEYGNLCKSSKSDFISCLTSTIEPQHEAPAVNGIVIDGGAMAHTSYPEFSTKILGEYCEVQVAKKIKALANVLGWI